LLAARRSVGGVDFARQLTEQNRAASGQSIRKFRSAAAPKGAKLPEGYVDRAKQREDQEEDDKAQRVKALEEMMKLQQIDEATFVKLRDEILGGEVESTHLVKGLDWKLLARIRRGEDVLSEAPKSEEVEEQEDLENQFDELEGTEVKAVQREERDKKGQMAPPSLIPGRKRTRDQILAELKAARKAEKEAKGPSLGAKFKKVGEKKFEPKIEKDSKGRDVIITIDEHGNEKRKVRKVMAQSKEEKGHGLLMPDKDALPLGMKVPDIPVDIEEDDGEDIFTDAGDDYDPLAGLEEDDGSNSDEEGEVSEESQAKKSKISKIDSEPGSMAPPPLPKNTRAKRNYFGDTETEAQPDARPAALTDTTILAAIKKASTIAPLVKEPENAEEAAREARRKRMLQQDDRDAQDMDMGFGSSRNDDEEDFEDKRIKLSQWGGKDDGDEDDGKGGSKEKRKRGGKKRKGDGNNAADVMQVLERRKAEKK